MWNIGLTSEICCTSGGRNCVEVNTPPTNTSGVMKNVVSTAMWSNFSASSPKIDPQRREQHRDQHDREQVQAPVDRRGVHEHDAQQR